MGRFAVRVAVSIAVLTIAIVAMVAAAAFFVYAFYLLLAIYLPAPAAAGLTGIAILIGALLLVALTGAAFRPRRRPKTPSLEGYETAAEAGNLLGRKVRGLLDAHSRGGLVAMFVAGFSIGVSPGLRRVLRELLKW
jgi:hypothetical protein